MIRPRDRSTASQLEMKLVQFSSSVLPLPGVADQIKRQVFVAQLIESMRRVELIVHMRNHQISSQSADPHHAGFNPIRAAIYHAQNGSTDEAYWLVFLLTHFGKHSQQGWALMKSIYGKLGANPFWTWQEISTNTPRFRTWLIQHQQQLSGLIFGNHRKYESLRADSTKGLASVIESYVNWISPHPTHDAKISSIIRGINDPNAAFEALYKDIEALHRWGRLAKFDHLTMLAKVGLIGISPGRAYLSQATGPKRGAALLLHNDPQRRLIVAQAEDALSRLGEHLQVGQQELEDSLCNWQKSPTQFVAFR